MEQIQNANELRTAATLLTANVNNMCNTNDIDEVVKSGGTNQSVYPVFKPLRDIKEEVDQMSFTVERKIEICKQSNDRPGCCWYLCDNPKKSACKNCYSCYSRSKQCNFQR